MNWYLEVLKKYAVFSGRSRRSEFWYFVLFNAIIGIVLSIIDRAIGTTSAGSGLLNGLYSLAVLIPSIGVSIRRLHDTNRSGWWILLGLIPIVGWIILIVWYAQDSNPGDNQYGSNPKMAAAPA